MNNELFIARSIDELPKESVEHNFLFKGGQIIRCKFVPPDRYFSFDGEMANIPVAYVSPITLEQLIAERPEVVEKITKPLLDEIEFLKQQIKEEVKNARDVINDLEEEVRDSRRNWRHYD